MLKSFQQDVFRKDTDTVVNILCPLSGLIFDQFALTAICSVQEWRYLLMETLMWPAQGIRQRFFQLLPEGKDVFSGCFDYHLQTEVKRLKDLRKQTFRYRLPVPGKSLSTTDNPIHFIHSLGWPTLGDCAPVVMHSDLPTGTILRVLAAICPSPNHMEVVPSTASRNPTCPRHCMPPCGGGRISQFSKNWDG